MLDLLLCVRIYFYVLGSTFMCYDLLLYVRDLLLYVRDLLLCVRIYFYMLGSTFIC